LIQAWRIDKAKRSKAESFSGEGARLVSGRWNGLGSALVYAASNLSLAALEKFVHLGEDGLGIKFVSYELEIPSTIKAIRWEEPDIPKDWRDTPAPVSTQKLGDEWLAGRRSAVLLVPSIVTLGELNVILNPGHPEFAKIRISDPKPFSFDPRMWK